MLVEKPKPVSKSTTPHQKITNSSATQFQANQSSTSLNIKNGQRSSDVQSRDCFSTVKEETREYDPKTVDVTKLN